MIDASSADESERELYGQGSCHVLVIALHRRLGWSFLVLTDPGSPYWEDEADADNLIPSVTHVLAVDPDGTAWDVFGARPAGEVAAEARERWYDVVEQDTDEFPHEGGLSTYVDGMAGPDGTVDADIDRPLHAFTEADVDEAWERAQAFLSGLPGFPAAAPTP